LASASSREKPYVVWVTWPSVVPNGWTIHTPQLFDGGAYATQAFEQGYFGAPVFWTGRY